MPDAGLTWGPARRALKSRYTDAGYIAQVHVEMERYGFSWLDQRPLRQKHLLRFNPPIARY